MRDPQRIERMLQQIESIWNAFPDMRLGQLMLNITRAETISELWSLEDARIEELLDTFMRLKVSPQGLRYVRRRENKNRGDRHDDFGQSWCYFEIDPACNVTRQIKQYDNGVVIGYNSRMSQDEFGNLATEPLDPSLEGFEFLDDAKFNLLWRKRRNLF